MKDFKALADKKTVEETMRNLNARGINTFYVENGKAAKEKVINLLKKGARVLVSSSATAEKIGLKDEIDNSTEFISVRKEYMAFDRKNQADKIRISRSTPDVIVASVHAVTKNGEVLIASNTGSQLAGYVAGADKVIWIVGTEKIVENLDEGFKRIYEYVLPIESEKLNKLYGVPSNVSKLLIINKEIIKDRITLIFINEALGY